MKIDTKLLAVAQVRDLLAQLERNLELAALPKNELHLLYAVRLISDHSDDDVVEAADLRNHSILQDMSQPTFNRTLRSLVEKDYLQLADNCKAKRYTLGPRSRMHLVDPELRVDASKTDGRGYPVP